MQIVPLIPIGGLNIVKSGNYLIDGSINNENLTKSLKKVTKRAFAHKPQSQDDLKLTNCAEIIDEFRKKIKIPRELYIQKYGPTTGDKIYLGDTNLVIEIERDFISYGDELIFGKTVREAMGQSVNVRNDIALDSIITNVIVIDAIGGIFKGDIGIKDGMIQGVGKGGNPHTMQITPGMVVGVGTDVIRLV